ncbi:High Incidence of Males (increased X chromosome loss) [Paramuricea clavata]|uniref:High Incidence of Males (Increased X chromosome loss) n=1 Tax=Paramuricea clavata TaxID=317549 RepID=A0A6S7ICR1_PARCT|nr:High Incidence of Males (increased X chromosome loss) [Paramuricea clavata]
MYYFQSRTQSHQLSGTRLHYILLNLLILAIKVSDAVDIKFEGIEPQTVLVGDNVTFRWRYTGSQKSLLTQFNVLEDSGSKTQLIYYAFGLDGKPELYPAVIEKYATMANWTGDISKKEFAFTLIEVKEFSHKKNFSLHIEHDGNIREDANTKDALFISVPPEVQLLVEKTNVSVGDRVTIQCHTLKGRPPPNISWYHDNTLMNGRYLFNQKEIELKDAGSYRCDAKNNAGEDKSEVKSITVNEKPVLREEPVNPLTTSFYTLTLNIPKPGEYIREVMVIVQNAKSNSVLSENLRTSDLKPYQTNTKDPYVTAYLKADVLPLVFVIGEGKDYNSEKEKYFNQPLKQNSSYIVFLRYFESEGSYYSTKWSSNVRTMIRAPDKANDISSGTEWYIVLVSLVSGIIIGILLSYIVSCYRRKLRSTKSQSNTEPQDDATYQGLDLTKMNPEDNYESLRVNTASNDTENDDNSAYTLVS